MVQLYQLNCQKILDQLLAPEDRRLQFSDYSSEISLVWVCGGDNVQLPWLGLWEKAVDLKEDEDYKGLNRGWRRTEWTWGDLGGTKGCRTRVWVRQCLEMHCKVVPSVSSLVRHSEKGNIGQVAELSNRDQTIGTVVGTLPQHFPSCTVQLSSQQVSECSYLANCQEIRDQKSTSHSPSHHHIYQHHSSVHKFSSGSAQHRSSSQCNYQSYQTSISKNIHNPTNHNQHHLPQPHSDSDISASISSSRTTNNQSIQPGSDHSCTCPKKSFTPYEGDPSIDLQHPNQTKPMSFPDDGGRLDFALAKFELLQHLASLGEEGRSSEEEMEDYYENLRYRPTRSQIGGTAFLNSRQH